MKFSTLLASAFAAALTLSACGGGSGSASGSATVTVSSPAVLSTSDSVVGTGAAAANGLTATVNYTGWLYNASASDFKGAKFDSGTFSFKLGAAQVVPGFEQGVVGMKVGGKRTILIPASLGYGAAGQGTIPGNSGLVFDVELTAVQ